MSRVSIHSLTPGLGAEIRGVDLREPLDTEARKEIHAAWLAHGVLFFRGQELDHEQHKAFGRNFGELYVHPNVPSHPRHEEILVIHADENSKQVGGMAWHSDVSCDEKPPKGSILRMIVTPESGGGDTLFSNMYAAYDALSDTWKRFLDPLTAVHESAHVHGRQHERSNRPDGSFVHAEHPVVRTHPETGRKALYVNGAFTTHICGMKPAESRATLDFLVRHMEHSSFQCRFQWEPHSIAMWDNRCVQHLATWDYFPETRRGYRITMKGDRPC